MKVCCLQSNHRNRVTVFKGKKNASYLYYFYGTLTCIYQALKRSTNCALYQHVLEAHTNISQYHLFDVSKLISIWGPDCRRSMIIMNPVRISPPILFLHCLVTECGLYLTNQMHEFWQCLEFGVDITSSKNRLQFGPIRGRLTAFVSPFLVPLYIE